MILSKIKKFINKYLYNFFLKPNHSINPEENKSIQIHEYELGAKRLKDILLKYNYKTFIDIGASYGDFINLVKGSKENVEILGFEPVLSVFNSLQDRYSNVDQISLYNLALGDFDGSVDFHENEYTYSSSILPIGDLHVKEFPFTKNYKLSEVKIASLDNFLSNKNLEKPILIKVDVQGYEGRVILGGKKTFSQADIVIVELSFCELYLGQPLFETINQELNQLGLFYSGCISQLCSPDDNSILQQDALYLRRF
jgi:FkbM family methyltransferase